MVNVNKLKGRIVEREMTIGKLSAEIGIDRATLYRKLGSGGDSITIKEARAMIEALELSQAEATVIFFADTVA